MLGERLTVGVAAFDQEPLLGQQVERFAGVAVDRVAVEPRRQIEQFGNILPPVKVVDVRPAYPEHLRPAGVAGTVTMTATIDRTGAVSELRDLSGPHPDLEAAAAEAIRQWEFTATLLNCQPIEVEMRVTVRFSAGP